MGSFIEINDTLQLTTEQGFPKELVFDIHEKTPFKTEDFKDRIFTFTNKPDVRIYKLPPVRNFLVHNIDGKWLYWGLVHVVEVTHDNVAKTTSGKFKIIKIYTPQQMRDAAEYMGPSKAASYFS